MIYLDHAASTPLSAAVRTRMQHLLKEEFANPSSLHAPARAARKVIEETRELVAVALGGRPDEVVFTSGGTESDNLAILGAARKRRSIGRTKVVVSAIEHHAVLDAAAALVPDGFEVVLAPVSRDGVVEIEALSELVDDSTALVSVMTANNETGVIQPIDEVQEIAHARGALVHTDAVQALAWMDISPHAADLVSVSAHKLGGPKGVGALLVRRGTKLEPLVHGGGQERGMRPGTLNTVGIGGFGAALDDILGNRPTLTSRVSAFRNQLQNDLLKLGGVHVSGAKAERLPGHLHVCVEGIESDTLLVLLDAASVCASSASACSSGASEASHVLKAMGIDSRLSRGALRLSLGYSTQLADVEAAATAIESAVTRLRVSK